MYTRTYRCINPYCNQTHTKQYRDGQRSPSTKPCHKCGGILRKAQSIGRPIYKELIG